MRPLVNSSPRPSRPRLAKFIALSLGLAAAALAFVPFASANGTTSLADAFSDGASFTPVQDEEMAQARGGYRGISFGIYFSGSVTNGATGELPPGVSVTENGESQVQIQASLGDFGGASGLFQFTNVVGDMNVVNNSIVINVNILPDLPSDVAPVLR